MDKSIKILSDLTHYMKYAKYLPEQQRRETYEETVDRNKNMHLKKFPDIKDEIEGAYKDVYQKKILPSMRSMQFSGTAIEVNPTRMFNCSFLPIIDYHCFSETMFLLLSVLPAVAPLCVLAVPSVLAAGDSIGLMNGGGGFALLLGVVPVLLFVKLMRAPPTASMAELSFVSE